MNLKRVIMSLYTENCYILWDENKIGAVIDPGSDFEKIEKVIAENNIIIKEILLTHSHFDHITSAKKLADKYNLPVKMSYNEKDVFENPENSMDVNIEVPDRFEYFYDGDIINAGDIELKVIETPGHTRGSVCFLWEKEKILFSGDTLFKSTVGRWDFPTGSFEDLENSIKNKLYKLPQEVTVHSGHGFSTKIGREKETNGVIRC